MEAAPGVAVPVLLLYGEKDEIIPAKPTAKLQARLPEHEYRLYAEGYHMLLRDLHPEAAREDILEFIERDQTDNSATAATSGN